MYILINLCLGERVLYDNHWFTVTDTIYDRKLFHIDLICKKSYACLYKFTLPTYPKKTWNKHRYIISSFKKILSFKCSIYALCP